MSIKSNAKNDQSAYYYCCTAKKRKNKQTKECCHALNDEMRKKNEIKLLRKYLPNENRKHERAQERNQVYLSR